ncbi:hypothetical protein BKA57DRAFT_439434 [Linnemannia elongata]|nr:hypothetical protein BKA57DRAFT_439434 [Linnemannia elongata]
MHDLYAEQQKNPYEPFITVDLLGLADNHVGSWEIKGKFPLAIPTVACYGPGKDDWAIVVPDYDPGYAFKSPKVCLPYNRIMLITRVVYFITVSTLEAQLPKKADEPIQKFLLSVIRDTMKVLNRNGILALLDRAKAEMKQVHVTQTQHLHTAGHGLNKSEIQQSITNTHMKAIGHPDSQERADQWNDLIESRTIPCPNALAYGTGVHRSWFLSCKKV